jgi:hypothetical protein
VVYAHVHARRWFIGGFVGRVIGWFVGSFVGLFIGGFIGHTRRRVACGACVRLGRRGVCRDAIERWSDGHAGQSRRKQYTRTGHRARREVRSRRRQPE